MQPSTEQQQVLEAVLTRAAEDADFRRELVADPHRAIRTAFGVTIPESFRIRFIEKEPEVDALVVLPDLRAKALSDDDLEIVSGGAGASQHHRWKTASVRRRFA